MSDNDDTLTFNLFARPSFIEGISRVVGFGSNSNIYNRSKTAEEADVKALSNDWQMVGKDIKSSMEQYGEE